jgi:hypothetical protein
LGPGRSAARVAMTRSRRSRPAATRTGLIGWSELFPPAVQTRAA